MMEEKICIENIDELIRHNMAFLIKTVSSVTGRYVSIENDDEFSIALLAFSEAVERFDSSKGSFFSYARLVMESRLKSYLIKKQSRSKESSLETLEEKGIQFQEEQKEENEELLDEIDLFKQEISYFGLTLDALVESAPKHVDTRQTAFQIAQKSSRNDEIVTETYKKRKLPVRMVALWNEVSEKIVKRSKQFILATMIIFVKKFPELQLWLKGTRCSHDQ